jgi:hypothetical protein
MTRDDLIILAREAGLDFSDPRVKQIVRSSFNLGAAKEREALRERFQIVTAAETRAAILNEREACADLVENFEYQDKTGRHDVFFLLPHEHVAKAIRARGKA